ncbi:hypothetical protein HANVADRAFT_120615 [Hanseniaspora valbyensis NRRL Y-1626]|uniref:Uncharacterized protein n=1 Tax=Hanseniaspora valbyensis NRRL Y-1626 TaxID=766949 RepID=A0A1B7THZ2_9ASCO|nr:hypothetical protein HANVADRAFT_120615 [Hanseniaspora valbyensis NRRL Y-1626]
MFDNKLFEENKSKSQTPVNNITMAVQQYNNNFSIPFQENFKLNVDINNDGQRESSNDTLHSENCSLTEFEHKYSIDELKVNKKTSTELDYYGRKMSLIPKIFLEQKNVSFPKMYYCKDKLCTEKFLTNSNCMKHYLLHHLSNNNLPLNKKYEKTEENIMQINLACKMCTKVYHCFFRFESLNDYIDHYKQHESEKFIHFIIAIHKNFIEQNENSKMLMIFPNSEFPFNFLVKPFEVNELIEIIDSSRAKQGLSKEKELIDLDHIIESCESLQLEKFKQKNNNNDKISKQQVNNINNKQFDENFSLLNIFKENYIYNKL